MYSVNFKSFGVRGSQQRKYIFLKLEIALTKICFTIPVLWNHVVNPTIVVKVERLELIKQEIAHVLVHVVLHNSPVKVIDDPPTVHDLRLRLITLVMAASTKYVHLYFIYK